MLHKPWHAYCGGWCRNPDCPNFEKVVPIKHGRTMICFQCGNESPVVLIYA